MRIQAAALLAIGILCGANAQAQTPIGHAFPAIFTEDFDLKTAGIGPGFTGFKASPSGGDVATITALQQTQNLAINNRQNVLPPIGVNNLYGIGNDVRIQFGEGIALTRFGGQLSRTNIAVGVSTVTMQFLANGVQVGNTMTVALPPTGGPGTSAYVWIGFDTSAIGAFNEVRILGNGTSPGYVGMDSLRATP